MTLRPKEHFEERYGGGCCHVPCLEGPWGNTTLATPLGFVPVQTSPTVNKDQLALLRHTLEGMHIGPIPTHQLVAVHLPPGDSTQCRATLRCEHERARVLSREVVKKQAADEIHPRVKTLHRTYRR